MLAAKGAKAAEIAAKGPQAAAKAKQPQAAKAKQPQAAKAAPPRIPASTFSDEDLDSSGDGSDESAAKAAHKAARPAPAAAKPPKPHSDGKGPATHGVHLPVGTR
eukprot:2834349-Prymnesium_polylepis.1